MLSAVMLFALMTGPAADIEGSLAFERVKISPLPFEAASVCDMNNDGKPDIVSGEFWYEGPEFTKGHKYCTVAPQDEYMDDFGDFPMDVNGDGFVDIVSGGYWGMRLLWWENPKGGDALWADHTIAEAGSIERLCAYDLDGDGVPELIPNETKSLTIHRLVLDANGKGTGQFEHFVVRDGGQGHGLGFGDLNADGRADIILCNGWFEQPAAGLAGQWIWHQDFDLASACVPVLVYDVNKDGLNDMIVGQAHAYGLDWFEKLKDGSWLKHAIDPDRSQYHDMLLADIDNDGEPELVTGKRYRAHNGHDPGGNDPIGAYYFKIDGGKFDRVTLDYGPADTSSGIGIFCWVADVNGNGWRDLVAPGKEGLYLFKNKGPK